MASEAKRYMTKPRIIEWLKGSLNSPDIHVDVDCLVRIIEERSGNVTTSDIDEYLKEYKE